MKVRKFSIVVGVSLASTAFLGFIWTTTQKNGNSFNLNENKKSATRKGPKTFIQKEIERTKSTTKNATASMILDTREPSKNVTRTSGKGMDEKLIQSKQLAQEEGFKIVYFMGLEGVGHHLISALLKDSPHIQTLNNDLDIIPNLSSKLRAALFYHQRDASAMWGSFCVPTGPDPSPPQQYQTLISHLSKTQKQANNVNITLPLNCIKDGAKFGASSYPNFITKCRQLTYPNLDILFRACDQADVDCRQIYIYRDPASVIASTTQKRKFNPTILQGIHLYTSHLYVIYAQLTQHFDKTIACHGFYDATLSHEVLWGPFRDLFGWKNDTIAFNTYINSIYQPPEPLTPQQQKSLIPSQYDIFMKSFYDIHDRVVNMCRQAQKRSSPINNDHQLPPEPLVIHDNIRPFLVDDNDGDSISRIKIVMTIGLHGAGQDILSSIFDQMINPNLLSKIQPLQAALYNNSQPELGLLSMHCSASKIVDIEQVYDNVVSIMKDLASDVSLSKTMLPTTSKQATTVIPLTFLSYPNTLVPPNKCQQLDYVNLDVFYSACDAAGIDCEHVFVYRDPYSLLHEVNELLKATKNSSSSYLSSTTGTKSRKRRKRRARRRRLIAFDDVFSNEDKPQVSERAHQHYVSTRVEDRRSERLLRHSTSTRSQGRLTSNKNRPSSRKSFAYSTRTSSRTRTSLAKKKTTRRQSPSNKKPKKPMPSSFSLLYYIHMYTTMLYVIHAQLVTHPNRIGGCLDMNNNNKNQNDNYDNQLLWDSIQSIYGLSVSMIDGSHENVGIDSINVKAYLQQQLSNQAIEPFSDEERNELVPKDWKLYMDSIMLAHDKAIRLCHEQIAK